MLMVASRDPLSVVYGVALLMLGVVALVVLAGCWWVAKQVYRAARTRKAAPRRATPRRGFCLCGGRFTLWNGEGFDCSGCGRAEETY